MRIFIDCDIVVGNMYPIYGFVIFTEHSSAAFRARVFSCATVLGLTSFGN